MYNVENQEYSVTQTFRQMREINLAKFWGSKMTIFTFPKSLIYQFRETTVTWRVSQAEKELNDWNIYTQCGIYRNLLF